MKICIISNSIVSTFRFRNDLINNLLKKNEVHILANNDTFDKVIKFNKKTNLQYLFSRSNSFKIKELLKDIFLIKRYIKINKIDIIYVNSWHSIFILFIIINLSKIIPNSYNGYKIFFNVAGLGNYFTKKNFRSIFIKNILLNIIKYLPSKKTILFFQNNQDYRYFKINKIIKSKKSFIIEGSGIDLEKFQYNKINTLDKKIILFVGRSLVFKGIKELISVAKKITKEYDNVYFDIVLINNKNNPDFYHFNSENNPKIKFYYNVKNIINFYKNSSVFILPSYREGCSRSILEALSVGRPVITTFHGGGPETVINNFNGYLIPKKNTRKLYEKIKYLVENNSEILRMSLNSRLLAETKFDIKKLNSKITNLFYSS